MFTASNYNINNKNVPYYLYRSVIVPVNLSLIQLKLKNRWSPPRITLLSSVQAKALGLPARGG